MTGELRGAAARVLAANWAGAWTVPSRTLYPHQWSWDSAFIALGLRHVAPGRARQELNSLLAAQWADGRLPHIVFDPAVPADAYFPGPGFWGARTSGLVQPPVHALAAWEVFRADPAGARHDGFLPAAYPRLAAWHRYLRDRRDLGGDGLVALIHPWESGTDNSPAWDAPLAAVDPVPIGALQRRDLDPAAGHATAAERPTDLDYGRYVRLAAAYRDRGYADTLDTSGFAVEDPMTNALLVLAEHAMTAIAAEIGADPAPHRTAAAELTGALVGRLYDADAGTFLARDLLAGRVLDAYTVAGLVPLAVPDLPVAGPLVKTALGERFQLGTAHLVPSYDLTAPDFDPARYWRGPAWYNTSWLVWRGLRAHGEAGHAADLRARMLACAARAGFREYVDPHTGAGHGSADFSWTAALVLDLLATRA
ncbi:MAG: MGH1-like glycoside hydrolase domain-containing protein [Mycobacteriales bacterium]